MDVVPDTPPSPTCTDIKSSCELEKQGLFEEAFAAHEQRMDTCLQYGWKTVKVRGARRCADAVPARRHAERPGIYRYRYRCTHTHTHTHTQIQVHTERERERES
jgi:hypothetical protein